MLRDLLPSDKLDAVVELQAYFKGVYHVMRNLISHIQYCNKAFVFAFLSDGFGNKTRIDYGSGNGML
jgi:hypothetical protein